MEIHLWRHMDRMNLFKHTDPQMMERRGRGRRPECRPLCQLIISLMLAVCLLTGCLGPAGSGNGSGGQTPSAHSPEGSDSTASSYEKYDEAALKSQQAFDDFTEQLFLDEVDESLLTLHYTLTDPAAYGITDYPRTFDPVSLDASRQVSSDLKSLNEQLNTIDSRLLTEEQRLTYTILSSYTNTLLESDGMELYDQPLSSSLGIQSQLPILLAEYAFYSKQDVEDYLSLLSSIDSYFDSIVAFEKEKTAAGLGLCDTVIDRILDSCRAYLLDADHSFMSETFKTRIEQLEGLSDQERDDYIARNRAILNEHFVPAYERLMAGLTELKGTGGNEKGLSYLPMGKEYYQYLVNVYTGTSYTNIPELKKAISSQMLADLTAMNTLLYQHNDLAEKLSDYSFALKDPNQILDNLKNQCSADFPPIGDYSYTIKDVPQSLESVLSPAFYLTVPIDRPQDNSIYINHGSTDAATNLYTTLAHEGYPGHMYQTLYFNQNNSSNIRKLLNFSGYVEGWATYVEYYSYTLVNGLPPGLGELLQHNAAFTLALYALLDLNIHYDGWDMAQIESYLNQYFSISDPDIVSTIYYDVAENPANYLEYYVGYLEILNMQTEAKKTLGSAYTDLAFNRFLLDIGPAPFSVIKPYFNQWLVKQSNTP